MKKALIVVDFQNDFVDGALGFKGAEKLEDIIEAKINLYLENNHDILFTLDTHYEDYLETDEGKRLPIIHCLKGTIGHDVYGKVNNYLKKAKKVFIKNTFGSIDLGLYLKENNYDVIEIAGLVTNMCVISNAVIAKAALPNVTILVDKNAVMSFDNDLHLKTLDVLKGMHVDIV